MEHVVGPLRKFNRAWSRSVGALEESFLGSGRALGPNRVLYELDESGVGVAELRERLDLDSGYTSRLLRQLEDEGLVRVETDPTDARRRRVRPTPAGMAARTDLERRSEHKAREVAGTLSPRLQSRLAALLAEADRVLRSPDVAVVAVPPSHPDAREAVTAYLRELDELFATGFDPEQAERDEVEFTGRSGRFLVARSGSDVVGCGALRWLGPDVAEIKRMWVHPDWRGLGVAARLLRRLEETAVEHGRPVVRLDTNAELTAAIAMYRSAGYVEVPRYNDNPYAQHWFEKPLGAPSDAGD